MIRGTGTIIDVMVIILAGLVGIRVGKNIESSLRETLMTILGLMAIVTGIKMAIEADQLFVALISLSLGIIIGDMIKLEKKLEVITEKSGKQGILKGLVTASMLSLIGPLAILGPLNEGLGNGYELLAIKAVFDGVSTTLLASILGFGVVLSAIPVLLVQGGLTIFAVMFGKFITDPIINAFMSVGGIMIVAVGLDLLSIKKIGITNMLPSLGIVPFIVVLAQLVGFIGP